MTEHRSQRRMTPYFIALLVIAGFAAGLIMMLRAGTPTADTHSGKRIGVVDVNGPIIRLRPQIKAVEDLADDDSVAAILVRIDSPGGAVGPSQEMYEALFKARKKKPVVVSMGSIAASGGFYIASAATKILADPGTLTGSIGVIMGFPDISKLLSWAKVRMQVVKTGPFKDTGAFYRPMTDAERTYLQGLVDNVLTQFIDAVAKGRQMAGVTTAAVRAIADGRVFTGQQALRMHLIDALGSYSDAVSEAAKLGGIQGKPTLYRPRLKPPWIQRVMENGVDNRTFIDVPLNPVWLMWLP